MSVPQMPHAATRNSTSPSPISGIGHLFDYHAALAAIHARAHLATAIPRSLMRSQINDRVAHNASASALAISGNGPSVTR